MAAYTSVYLQKSTIKYYKPHIYHWKEKQK